MRDDEPWLGELFEATRSVERAPKASRDELRHAVAKHLVTAGVLATSATVAKGASAAAAAGGSGIKLSSLVAGISTKLAVGIVAAASAIGGIGYVLHHKTQSGTNSSYVQSGPTTRAPISTNADPNPLVSANMRLEPAADTTPGAAADTTPGAAADTTPGAAADTNHAMPASAAADVSNDRATSRLPNSRSDETGSKGPLPFTKPQKESLAEELALIRAAQSELSARRAGEALSLLSRYFRSFPRGTLVPEAQVARIRALCLSGRQAQAESEALRFVRSNPNSPLAARVRGGCATQ